MEFAKAIEHLEGIGVPVNSPIRTAQYMNDHLPNVDQASAMIQTLTNASCSDEGKDRLYVPYVAAYVVFLAVKAHVKNETMKMLDILSNAKQNADAFLDELAWTFVGEEAKAEIENADPEIVKAGKAKKGARKVLALKVYNEHIADKDLTRKEAIAVLVEHVGLTPAGASTYYANFKSGKWS